MFYPTLMGRHQLCNFGLDIYLLGLTSGGLELETSTTNVALNCSIEKLRESWNAKFQDTEVCSQDE